jgi:hypothetical protein
MTRSKLAPFVVIFSICLCSTSDQFVAVGDEVNICHKKVPAGAGCDGCQSTECDTCQGGECAGTSRICKGTWLDFCCYPDGLNGHDPVMVECYNDFRCRIKNGEPSCESGADCEPGEFVGASGSSFARPVFTSGCPGGPGGS